MPKQIKNYDTFLHYTDHRSSKAKEIRSLVLDLILCQLVNLEDELY